MEKIQFKDRLIGLGTSSKIIIARDETNALSSSDSITALASINPNGREIITVPTFVDFKNADAVIREVQTGGPLMEVMLAYNEIECPEGVVKAYAEYQRTIIPLIEKIKGLRPDYPFATPPAEFTNIAEYFGIKKNKKSDTIRRRTGSTAYSINTNSLEILWAWASQYWVSQPTGAADMRRHYQNAERLYLYVGGTTRRPYFDDNQNPPGSIIRIDCQRIARWELEQLALHYGYRFPQSNKIGNGS